MRASVNTSANGSPALRAKRSRTACRLVMGSPFLSGVGIFGRGPESLASVATRNRLGLSSAGAGRAPATGLRPFAGPGKQAALWFEPASTGGGSAAERRGVDQPGLVKAHLQPPEDPVQQAALAHLVEAVLGGLPGAVAS